MDTGIGVREEAGIDRRALLTRSAILLGASGPVAGLLAACGDDDDSGGTVATSPAEAGEGTAIVGDVLDFALSSDEWKGAFGFVSMRLHRGVVDGEDAWFIRTDASDRAFAESEGLVFAPRIAPLTGSGLSGDLYLVEDGVDDQPTVLSADPRSEAYTPAWQVSMARWRGEPKPLESVADVERAGRDGALEVERTETIMNAPICSWAGGAIGVDRQLRDYLGEGQLIEEPDTDSGEIMFKLHECFPNARYIVCDHSIEPGAEMTATVFAPGLHSRPTEAEATGRTNVFMNGLAGPGPMKFQPSVFDSDPGDPIWSPYWDHFTYAWSEDATPRVLRTERQVYAARDAGELEEFPGTPDTKGEVFTVNCPVPVTAPATFSG